MTKFQRRDLSEGKASDKAKKKKSKTVKISANKAKITKFLELEDEIRNSIDSGYGESQPRVTHRYPTRASIAAQALQNDNQNQTKSSRAKPAKPKRYKKTPDVNKENDGSAANGIQPRQRTSSNKRRSSELPISRPDPQDPVISEEINSTKERLSQCSSDNWMDHIRWLQARRDIGLWIECSRKGCGKWRYAENYHDPLDVPKIWYCEMNTDTRFADCSIPQEETPEAENQLYIENAYNAGSIVWARVVGFPWWPAMVDDCPELLKYWDIRGSSIVPYKYHVKFFNEMKIAWMPVRNLKPYVTNPRSTFLKKTVFRSKDYSQELDAACELANQALQLSLLERLKRFSWAAQISGVLREEDEDLAPAERAAKKKKSSNKSTIDPRIPDQAAANASSVSSSTRKRPVDKNAKKNVTRNTRTNIKENVTGKQKINVRSRIIDIETDSTINTGQSISNRTDVPKRSKFDARRSDLSSCRDKTSFPEPNELLKGNSIDRSDVDNFNIDDAPVSSPASKSTQSTQGKRQSTEEAYKPRCTRRVTIANIAALAQEISNSRPSYEKKARDSRAATQIATTSGSSLAFNSRELSPRVRSDERLDRSSVDPRSSVEATADIGATVSGGDDRGRFSSNDIFAAGTSQPEAFAGTEEPSASPWQPIEIDLTGSSADFEEYNDRRESPDCPNEAERRDNSQPPNRTIAPTSNGLDASFDSVKSCGYFGSLALSSQPERDEMADRCHVLGALSVDLEGSDSSVDAATCIESNDSASEDRERFFATSTPLCEVLSGEDPDETFLKKKKSTPRPEVGHSRSPHESDGASSFGMDDASFGELSGRFGAGSELNFSAGRSEGASSFRMNAASFGERSGRSEINLSAGRSEGVSFRTNAASFGERSDRSEINLSAGRSEGASFRTNAASFGERSGQSEINLSAGRSEGASFRTNAASLGGRSGRSGDGSEINFLAGQSGTNFLVERSGTNLSAPQSRTNSFASGSETNFSAGKDESSSSFGKPILIDLTVSSTDFEGHYDRQEYPDYPNNAETHADSRSLDLGFVSASNGFGSLNTARQFSYFESRKSFGSTAPELDEMSERCSNNSGWCVPLIDLEVGDPSVSANALPERDYSSRPNSTALLNSLESASSEYVILARFHSSGSDQSSDTVVPSSQPEMDRAFERRPRFPGLSDKLRYLSSSTYSLPQDIGFRLSAHSSSKCLFEVITIDD